MLMLMLDSGLLCCSLQRRLIVVRCVEYLCCTVSKIMQHLAARAHCGSVFRFLRNILLWGDPDTSRGDNAPELVQLQKQAQAPLHRFIRMQGWHRRCEFKCLCCSSCVQTSLMSVSSLSGSPKLWPLMSSLTTNAHARRAAASAPAQSHPW